jgi:uncharacterized protein YraI
MFVRRAFPRANRRSISVASCVLASCLAASAPLRVFAAEAKWTSYLRAGPGLPYAVLDEIAPHHPLTVQDCGAGWCRVLYERAEGYVQQDFLTEAKAAPVPPGALPNCFDVTLSGHSGGSHVRFCGK